MKQQEIWRRRPREPAEVAIRNMRCILGKMTFESLPRLAPQLRDQVISSETLRELITLIVEKATVEPAYARMYSTLCAGFAKEGTDLSCPSFEDGTVTFHRALIDEIFRIWNQNYFLLHPPQDTLRAKCLQRIGGSYLSLFTNEGKSLKEKEKEEEQIKEKMEAELHGKLPKELLEEIWTHIKREKVKRDSPANDQDERRKFFTKAMGFFTIVATLLEENLISFEPVLDMMLALSFHIRKADEQAELATECFCKLMIQLGARFDAEEERRKQLDIILDPLNALTTSSTLLSRLRFLLMDLFDLRKANWKPRARGN